MLASQRYQMILTSFMDQHILVNVLGIKHVNVGTRAGFESFSKTTETDKTKIR